MQRIKNILKRKTKKANFLKWDLQNEFILSLLFTMYALSLSAAAVKFSTQTSQHLNHEVTLLVSLNSSVVGLLQQRLISSLPIITFSMDLFILAVMICTSAAIATNYVYRGYVYRCIFKEFNWVICLSFIIWIVSALLLFAGIFLIIIWYTIKSYKEVLIAVGAIALIFAPIIPLVVCLVYKKKCCGNYENSDNENLDTWKFCAYSIVFPLSCVANHLNYIIIAFIHDLPHATSVAIVYGIVLLFFYGLLKQVSYLRGACKSAVTTPKLVCLLFVKLVLILFLSGYIAVSILLYFFLPIDDELDNAANHFISIYQTVFLFLTAMATYFLVSKPFRSPISIFTEAEFEFNSMGLNVGDDNYKSEIVEDQWSDLTDKECDLVSYSQKSSHYFKKARGVFAETNRCRKHKSRSVR